MNTSQKLRVISLYLFRVSNQGIRLCKSRIGRLSRVPSDKTLYSGGGARDPPSRSTVANIRGERYDTILIKILPLAFRHAIISLYRVINRREKGSANVWIIRLSARCTERIWKWLDNTHTLFFFFIYLASMDMKILSRSRIVFEYLGLRYANCNKSFARL